MREKYIQYIDRELENPFLTKENRDWFKVLKEVYITEDTRGIALKYKKALSTVYRKRKDLEVRAENKKSYQDRKILSSDLTVQQLEEIKEILTLKPLDVGLLSNMWTGNLLRTYISHAYGIDLSERSCQRLIFNFGKYIDNELVISTYQEELEFYEQSKEYEVWHIRRYVIWKGKKEKPSKGKIVGPRLVEGIFLAYNYSSLELYYKPFTTEIFRQYSDMVNDFIQTRREQRKKLVLVFSDTREARKKINEMNKEINNKNKSYKDVRVMLKPKGIEEEEYFRHVRKEIKGMLTRFNAQAWKRFQYKVRNSIESILKGSW